MDRDRFLVLLETTRALVLAVEGMFSDRPESDDIAQHVRFVGLAARAACDDLEAAL